MQVPLSRKSVECGIYPAINVNAYASLVPHARLGVVTLSLETTSWKVRVMAPHINVMPDAPTDRATYHNVSGEMLSAGHTRNADCGSQAIRADLGESSRIFVGNHRRHGPRRQ